MIEFKLGKTGSGKSYLCVKEIIDFLRDTNAYIATNMSLELGELNAYMQRHWPDRSIDTIGRVRILDAKESAEFFLHREYGNDLPAVSKSEEKLLHFPDFEAAAQKSGRPIVYVIDEAHIHFDARAWAQVGQTMNFYCSQHEKFSAHIILCTQFLKQVELRLREHASQFTECTNHAIRNILIFKQPKYFTATITYKAPPCPAETSDRYTLDKEIAACYRTTGGVGVNGAIAQRFTKNRKGWPIWTAPVIGLGLVLALSYGPSFLLKWGAKKTLGVEETTQAHTDQTTRPLSISPVIPPVEKQTDKYLVGQVPEGVYLTGAIRHGQRFVIVLSDGTVRTDRDNWDQKNPPIEAVSRTFADVAGRRYYYRPRPAKETPQAGAGTAPAGLAPASGALPAVTAAK